MDPVPTNEHPNTHKKSVTNSPPASPTANELIKNTISISAVYPESEYEPLPSTNTSRQNVRPFASRPRHSSFKNHAKSVALNKKHLTEHFASRAEIVKKPRFNVRLLYKLKPELCSWEISHWDSTRQKLTIRNSSVASQQIVVPLRTITAHQPR